MYPPHTLVNYRNEVWVCSCRRLRSTRPKQFVYEVIIVRNYELQHDQSLNPAAIVPFHHQPNHSLAIINTAYAYVADTKID